MSIVNMQDPIAARGVQLAALRSVVSLKITTGMTFRGVTSPIAVAQRMGYTGPRSLKKVLAWVEAEQEVNAAERLLTPPIPFGQ